MQTEGITERRDVPNEPGEWFEIRKLSWHELKQAREARSAAVMGTVRSMGGEVMAALPRRCKSCGEEKHAGDCPPPGDREDASAADPTNPYDQEVILYAGIASWSYQPALNKENRTKLINGIDEPTADWLFREIVAYNTIPKGEAAKNETRPSSSS